MTTDTSEHGLERLICTAPIALRSARGAGRLERRASDRSRAEQGGGEAEVRLELRATGALAGRVRLEAGFPRAMLVPWAGFLSAPGEVEDWEAGVLDENGEFLFRGLKPGPWRVTIDNYLAGELVTIDDVIVTAGATARDARLDPIALEGGLRVLTLAVVDERGAKLSGGTAMPLFGEEEEEELWAVELVNGEALLLTRGAAIDVAVGVPGYLTRHLEGLVASTTVELRRGPRVRFVLTGAPLPRPPLALSVRPVPVEAPPWGDAWDPALEVAPDGSARWRATWLGATRPELWVTREDEDSRSSVRIEGEVPAATLLDQLDEQVIELRLDAAALEEAVRALDE